MNINNFAVTGNVGGHPELRKKSDTSGGVVSFTLAQNVMRLNEKTKKFEQAHTNWFPIRTFGSLAARVKAGLKKGDRVTVFGKLRTYQYENEGGSKVSAFEVLADDVSISGILPRAPGAPGAVETDELPDFPAF